MKSPIFWVKRLGQIPTKSLFLKVGSLPMTHWAAKKEQLLKQDKDWPESTAEDKICWKRSPFAPDCHQPGLHHCLHPHPRHHPHHNHHLVDRKEGTILMGKLLMPCFAPAALSSERQEFWCRCRHWFGFCCFLDKMEKSIWVCDPEGAMCTQVTRLNLFPYD